MAEMRLTPGQQRLRHCNEVLTPSIVKLIRESSGTIEGKSWAIALGVSENVIYRIRKGLRGVGWSPNFGGARQKRELSQASSG